MSLRMIQQELVQNMHQLIPQTTYRYKRDAMRWMYVHNDMALSILDAWVARISFFYFIKSIYCSFKLFSSSSHALLQIVMDIVMSLCECLSSINVMIIFCYALLHKASWSLKALSEICCRIKNDEGRIYFNWNCEA